MRIDDLGAGLFRILVPFDGDVTTTVYVVLCDDGVVLIDSATYPSDVDHYIIPALKKLEISLESIGSLLLTHNHGDHAGGAKRLLELAENATIRASFAFDSPKFVPLTDGELVCGRLQVVSLPGHTEHSVGFLDLETKNLLSGDCLQLKGVGKYRNGIGYPSLYIESCERLKNMDIRRIVTAHEYDPLGSIAAGECEVRKYLDLCIEVAKRLIT